MFENDPSTRSAMPGEIEEVVRHFFRDASCRPFGAARGPSLHRRHQRRDPDLDRCAVHGRGPGT